MTKNRQSNSESQRLAYFNKPIFNLDNTTHNKKNNNKSIKWPQFSTITDDLLFTWNSNEKIVQQNL